MYNIVFKKREKVDKMTEMETRMIQSVAKVDKGADIRVVASAARPMEKSMADMEMSRVAGVLQRLAEDQIVCDLSCFKHMFHHRGNNRNVTGSAV